MQKTFLKFVMFELVERIARFRLLLNECADDLHESAPGLKRSLNEEAGQLEERLLSQRNQLNKLFVENNNGKQSLFNLDPVIEESYGRLCELSRVLLHLKQIDLSPETYLFLKDALPADLTKGVGEQSVLLTAEGDGHPVRSGLLSKVLVDVLPVLQKNNPLAWVSLTRSYARHLLENASTLEALKLELVKSDKLKLDEATVESLLVHALNLRLQGPAYYFQALAEAVLNKDESYLPVVEPALFFGLNHQNFTHKNLVIMHEACEKARPEGKDVPPSLTEDVLTDLFHKVEKLIPAKAAFNEKNLERAIALQERLGQGVLLSSTPLYPVGEVAETLERDRKTEAFSIYGPLGMMTEYPHSPREIVNAGWLHKVERGPVWLYSILNEERSEGFEKVLDILDYQDHLLRKSIETSEVHRVLIST